MPGNGRKLRLCIIPRWSAREHDDWYPWLAREARRRRSVFESVCIVAAPNPHKPSVEQLHDCIVDRLGWDAAELARTVLVGHSVGARAALRYLCHLPQGFRVAGMVAVAGWWTVDKPWDTLRPWLEEEYDLLHIRSACHRFAALLSDDDPITRDWTANARDWVEKLCATVTIAPGAGHFNHRELPLVLETVLRMA